MLRQEHLKLARRFNAGIETACYRVPKGRLKRLARIGRPFGT